MAKTVRAVLVIFLFLLVTLLIFSGIDLLESRAGDQAAPILYTATAIAGGLMAIVILLIAFYSHRFGTSRAAGWLVSIGAVVVLMEHGAMTIARTARLGNEPDVLGAALLQKSHARLHFFMAGIFAVIALVLLIVIATTLLREARREGWYALLFALLFGGTFELLMGGSWYPKGMPLFRLLGLEASGWGWQWQYLYLLAWGAALVITYRPVFRKSSPQSPEKQTAA